MTAFDLVLIALAASAAINAWMQPNGICEDLREWLIVWIAPDDEAYDNPNTDEDAETPRRCWDWSRHMLTYGIQCPFCLTFHVVFWLTLLYLAGTQMPTPWGTALMVPIWTLAAARVSHFIDMLQQHISPQSTDPSISNE